MAETTVTASKQLKQRPQKKNSGKSISILMLSRLQIGIISLFVVLFMATALLSFYRLNLSDSESAFEIYNQNLYRQLQQCSELYRNISDVFNKEEIQNAVFRSGSEEDSSPETMQNLLNYIIEVNPAIDSLFVVAKNGTRMSFSRESDVYLDTIYSRYQQAPFYSNPEPVFSTIIPRVSEHEKPLLFYLFSFSNLKGVDKTDSAVCGILCNADSLFSTITLDQSEESILACVFQDTVIWSNKDLSMNETSQVLAMHGNDVYSFDGRDWFGRIIRYPDFDWSIRYCVPKDIVLHSVIDFRNILFVCLTLFVLLLGILLLFTRSFYTRPFRKLTQEIGSISNYDARLSPSILTELDNVGNAVNNMLEELNESTHREQELRDKLYQSMLAQTRAQLYAYRLQINPHFLFNTMECMRSMADYYGAGDLEQIISSLSELFRYTLHAPAVTTLEKEIDHVRNYCTIMNLRGSQVVDMKYEIDEGTGSLLLPSISLQPIVENCFRHAFKQKKNDQAPMVMVHSYLQELVDGSYLYIDIEDNGIGIPAEALQNLNRALKEDVGPEKRSSIGLSNIYHRLHLMSDWSDLSIDSVPGEFTRVRLCLPCETDNLLYIHK